MRSLVIFSSIFAVSSALQCYTGLAYGTTPTTSVNCAYTTTQCFKQTWNSTMQLYGCDVSQLATASVCSGILNGNCTTQDVNGSSVKTCCCGTDLCNGDNFNPPPPSPPPNSALRCYNQITNGTIKPTATYNCPANTTQCFQQTDTYQGNTIELFGCDIPQGTGAAVCAGVPNGKCFNQTGNGASVNTCCCNTNLCNGDYFAAPPKSAGLFQPLLAIGVLVLGRFI